MDCANLGQRNAGLLRNCPAGYNGSEERGSCFLPMDRQRKCTLIKGSPALTETPSQPQELWCGRNSPCKPNNTGMDCANLGQRNAGLLKSCPAGYNGIEDKGSCFLPMDRQRKCTLIKGSPATISKYAYPGPGYCIPDPNNPSFFILRPENTPGWGPGQNCWVTDGTVTGYGQKPCSGGSLDECKRRIDGNGNVFFTELN
jgi:hypothetical protein